MAAIIGSLGCYLAVTCCDGYFIVVLILMPCVTVMLTIVGIAQIILNIHQCFNIRAIFFK